VIYVAPKSKKRIEVCCLGPMQVESSMMMQHC